ncbi:MAG: 1,4-alpha-glucan branching protein GlgB [Verrucomicrobia bacterium]|nr:1,4-alpha-glucan branching protein GlgB [Verrucomicrobiota bacterium]
MSDELRAFLAGTHSDPFRILGPHRVRDDLVIRVFRPDAREVMVELDDGRRTRADRIHGDGLFQAAVQNAGRDTPYMLAIRPPDGSEQRTRDPYSFGVIMGEMDLHLFGEGNHWKLYEKFGAHLRKIGDATGVYFAVWAPNAQRVSVVGDFNGWDGRVHCMRKLIGSGVWELFIPGVRENAHYKFELRTHTGALLLKSDPFAFFSQHGKETASLVYDLGRFQWSDSDWMETRRSKNLPQTPISIYEVHLGSWRRRLEEDNRQLSYLELGDALIPYVSEMGYSHIELLPVAEHPFEGSWGYQVTNYYAPTSRFGTPDEFRNFIDRCHRAGIGVIMDWVPAHFPKDAHGLAEFDGTDLYEHMDPRQGEHQDWGTLIYNFGRNEVRNFLIANALFWLDKYHIDGLRVDAVASMLYLDYSRQPGQWIPNKFGGRENLEAVAFLKRFNEVCYERFPGIMTIAEESTAWPGVTRPTYLGGLGFGFKWNMGWMHDFLHYMELDPVHRRYHQGSITFSLLYAFTEHFILVLSHDEVVHGKKSLLSKMPGDEWQKFANLRMFYAWMFGHPGKKLLFMGGEIGQWREWNHDKQLDWYLLDSPLHDGLRRLIQHLNHLYKTEPALFDLDDSYDGFEWIDFSDAANSVVSFMRKSRGGDVIIFIVNGTPVVRYEYAVGAPGAGYYREIINTDAQTYAGTNIGNLGGMTATNEPQHGRSYSVKVNLPPLACVALKQEAHAPDAAPVAAVYDRPNVHATGGV